jgi:hypothetical protein
VQTITSSVDFVTGSTRFGSILGNTHTFTGSVSITGSLAVVTTGTEFQVGASGVTLGNAITDAHIITGSLAVTGGLVDINRAGQSLRIFPQTSSGSARIQLQNSGSGGLAGANAIIAIENSTGADLFSGTSPFSLVIGTATQKAFHLGANSAVVMTITGSNVGIGTTNPGQLFEVVGGEIKAGRVDSSNEGGQVSFGRSTDNATAWYIDAYGNTSSPQLRFVNVANSVVAMTLTGSYVGIGTSSPSNPLHLVNANHYQFKIQDSAASMLFGADDSTMIGIEMANSAGATWFIGPHDPGTGGIQDRLTIGRLSGTWSYPAKFSSGGNLTILGTLTQNASDIRLKDNIENIPNALNKILSLNGFIFNWNELASNLGPYSTDIKQVGVSAQEIQSVLPEAVFLAPFDVDSFDDNKSKSGENYLTVQYDKIIPLLIEGIKELKAQNDDLQSQINELKAQ